MGIALACCCGHGPCSVCGSSITAGAPWFESSVALAVGALGFFVMYASRGVLLRHKIDDPVAAFPVHGACGVWGLLATGLFRSSKDNDYWVQLLWQMVGSLVVVVWALVTMAAAAFVLRVALHGSIRRLNAEDEYRKLEQVPGVAGREERRQCHALMSCTGEGPIGDGKVLVGNYAVYLRRVGPHTITVPRSAGARDSDRYGDVTVPWAMAVCSKYGKSPSSAHFAL